jgi:adenosine deaminase
VLAPATAYDYCQKMIDGINASEYVKRREIDVKLLMSVNRKHSREEAMESVKVALAFPEYVVGVELGGDPKHHDWNHFEPVFQSARDAGLKIAIHCGEHAGVPYEIRGMIDFKPERLGHCIMLPHDEGLMEYLHKSKIPVEVCMTSNLITESVKSYSEHPVVQWVKNDHPISINTDDKLFFRSDASREHLVFAQTCNRSKEDLFKLTEGAIEQTFLDEVGKQRLRDLVAKRRRELLTSGHG